MNNKETAKKQLEELIQKYNRYKTDGRLEKINEDNTCKDFILPLFRLLGWGIESSEEVEGQTAVSRGRVDYGFYINDMPKYFLEAKAVPEDINNIKYIKQAIDYAYNKGVTWAVLTNFKNLKVFNADWHTHPLESCVLNLSIENYLQDFDLLWELSKEGIKENLLYKTALKYGHVTAKIPIGERLYRDLTYWRGEFFKYISQYCKGQYTFQQIDEIIQRILNRLIFIRTCEDRELEKTYLLEMVREWRASGRKYSLEEKLQDLFKDFNKWYDSKLFENHLCDKLDVNYEPYEIVIEGLYGSKDEIVKYNFNDIGVDVLGRVYEQYLGYVGKSVDVKKKKQLAFEGFNENIGIEKEKGKRKEQGIYYTPKHIVDYIVRNTLGEYIKNKKYNDLLNIKVLDPACGSGSFLISAYDTLDRYLSKIKGTDKSGYFDRLRMLGQNIYGVDLDNQAIEITRLNLLLKTLCQRAIMPILNNIKEGNSLLLNWENQFPEVFKSGGFDVIIGNPPYIKEYTNKNAFEKLHESPYYQGKMDIWTMFASIAIDLLKEGGYLSFIAPANWLTNAGASKFRNKILSEGEIVKFIDFGDFKVFNEAGIQTMIFIFQKKKARSFYKVQYIKIDDKNISTDTVSGFLNTDLKKKEKGLNCQEITLIPGDLKNKIISFTSDKNYELLNKINKKRNFNLLDNEVGQGIVAAPDKCFLVNDIDAFNEKEKIYIKKYYTNAKKYYKEEAGNYIIYLSEKNFSDQDIDNFPNIKNHFDPYKKVLQEAKIKYGTPNKPYYYLHREREEKYFNKGQKIICAIRTYYPNFLYTEEDYYCSRALNVIKTDRINIKYLTAILNSTLSYFWLKNKGKQIGDLLQIDKAPLLNIPLIKTTSEDEKLLSDMVDKMLELNKTLHERPEMSEEWKRIKEEIEKMDKKIDLEVYRIYDLKQNEIDNIENDLKKYDR